MTANEFKSRWEAVVKQERIRAQAEGVPKIADDMLLVSAPRQIMDVSSFPLEAARFLVEAGLPASCAPFLSFEAVADGPASMVQIYGVQEFSRSDVSTFASLYVIGSDGAGNPLCLDAARHGEIVMLDHDDRFRTRTFIAASVATLAQALLVLQTYPLIEFVERVRLFDPKGADEAAFLPREVAMIIESDMQRDSQ